MENLRNFTDQFTGRYIECGQFSQGKPKDFHMQPVAALGNTRIFPDYRAQESPRTLICGDPCHASVSMEGMIVGATSALPCASLVSKSTTN